MKRVFSIARCAVLIATVPAVMGPPALADPVSAGPYVKTVRCGEDGKELQAALAEAAKRAGSIITLDDMCDDENFFVEGAGSFTLRGTERAGFDNEGFDGGPENVARALTITKQRGEVIIDNLIFRNSQAPRNGGAVLIDTIDGGPPAAAVSIRISRSVFEGNQAERAAGAISIRGHTNTATEIADSAFIRNSALDGPAGAAHITAGRVAVLRSTFRENHATGDGGAASIIATDAVSVQQSIFSGNTATTDGGGVSIFGFSLSDGSSVSVSIGDSRFERNVTASSEGQPAPNRGGGVFVASVSEEAAPPEVTVNQTRNDFRGNTAGPSSSHLSGGGAAWIEASELNSLDDRFVMNTVFGTTFESSSLALGGGLVYQGTPGVRVTSQLNAVNLVVAGNSLAIEDEAYMVVNGTCAIEICRTFKVMGTGRGAGLYVGGAVDTVATLHGSTISGNRFRGPNEEGTDAAADPSVSARRTLMLENSIVYTNGNGSEFSGWDAIAAGHSDVCSSIAGPLEGAGNICTEPLLVSASEGDVEQTPRSPTIDRGSNAKVRKGICCDFYRLTSPAAESPRTARIEDGDGDGKKIVDMGADERGVQPAGREGPRAEDSPAVRPPGQMCPGDPSCDEKESEGPRADPTCNDNKDNDRDGKTDGTDSDCVRVEARDQELPSTGAGSMSLLASVLIGGAAALWSTTRRINRTGPRRWGPGGGAQR